MYVCVCVYVGMKTHILYTLQSFYSQYTTGSGAAPYVCIYVCMYICIGTTLLGMCICMYVHTYICTRTTLLGIHNQHICMNIHSYVCIHAHAHAARPPQPILPRFQQEHHMYEYTFVCMYTYTRTRYQGSSADSAAGSATVPYV